MNNEELIEELMVSALEADKALDNVGNRDRIKVWLRDFDAHYPVSTVHDWRNHIPSVVSAHWNDLPDVAKLVAFIAAARAAGDERWD